jgi:hypothetical protein
VSFARDVRAAGSADSAPMIGSFFFSGIGEWGSGVGRLSA